MTKFRVATKFFQNNIGTICEIVKHKNHIFFIMRNKKVVAQLVKASSNEDPLSIHEIKTSDELEELNN